jgi:sugar/nucleoside kinase (ribokinase family)
MIVCTLGDLTLDVAVRLAGPVARGGDTDADIRLAPGGQAANVAAWVGALGARARFIGKRGNDEAGRLARAGLVENGVEVFGPAAGRNAVICSLVTSVGERSMASDRATATGLRADEIDPAWLASCEHLFVSGYALLVDPARSAALHAVELARSEGAAVSVDLSSWSAVQMTGAEEFRRVLTQLRPDVVFANEEEDRVLGGPLPDVTWILKRGARGCSFAGDERAALPVEQVVDSTGAGDALAAGWIVGGPELALGAAARCIQQLGSMPLHLGSGSP